MADAYSVAHARDVWLRRGYAPSYPHPSPHKAARTSVRVRGVNNRMGSGLAVGRTLKCERTGFWVGLQIAPRGGRMACGACVQRILRVVFAQFRVWVVLAGICG
jgi:hypothetical protein